MVKSNSGLRELSENEIIEIDSFVAATRRQFLKRSATAVALAGPLMAAACSGPEDGDKPDDDAPSSLSGAVGGAEEPEYAVTAADIAAAERVMGIEYTQKEREEIVGSIGSQINAMQQARALDHDNSVAMASVFDPRMPGRSYPEGGTNVTIAASAVSALPSSPEDIAFAPLTSLAAWVRTGAITSAALTEIYLDRIERIAPKLECYVIVTAELAREEAARADREIAAGNYRGPLHGIPYAVKDLFDTADIGSSWGAMPYKDRVPSQDAAVVERLRQAGGVMLGKATLGALAYGDIWWGGKTRNPWNLEEGSSGSSAGPASATAGGLCGFSIGTETLGSIVSPSNRCGTTGLRPTFGRVSRRNAMALCWTLDKAGPICRSVEDTALVLAAIHGRDDGDPSSISQAFSYDGNASLADMRVGFMPAAFEDDAGATDIDKNALQAARDLGLNLVELSLPELPYGILVQQLLAEAAAAFEELTLSNRDDLMVWQDSRAWPNSFRAVRFLSAVDLVNIDRFRRQVMGVADELFSDVDALIGPNFAQSMLTITNFTGQPQLAIRAGFFDSPTRTGFGTSDDNDDLPTHSVPQAFSVWAPLFEEGNALRVGLALEQALGVVDRRPAL